jgi:hypothetical protein
MPVPTWAPLWRLSTPPPLEPELPSFCNAPPGVVERSGGQSRQCTPPREPLLLRLQRPLPRLLPPPPQCCCWQNRDCCRLGEAARPTAAMTAGLPPVYNGRQLISGLKLAPREVLAVPIRQHPEVDGHKELLQGLLLEGDEARQLHRLVDPHLGEA